MTDLHSNTIITLLPDLMTCLGETQSLVQLMPPCPSLFYQKKKKSLTDMLYFEHIQYTELKNFEEKLRVITCSLY